MQSGFLSAAVMQDFKHMGAVCMVHCCLEGLLCKIVSLSLDLVVRNVDQGCIIYIIKYKWYFKCLTAITEVI